MNNVSFVSLFGSPILNVELDLDLEKLTELAFQLQNKDKKGVLVSNEGGWQSDNIKEEKHEEFDKLKTKINQYLQIYHSEVFQGMVFKENVIQNLTNMWVNINEKHHWNDWHIHRYSTLSGAYYVKHDSTKENGDIMFKNPIGKYMEIAHVPKEIIEHHNEITCETMRLTPQLNMLVIFPSWLEHRVGENLKNDTRISLAFNSNLLSE